MGSGKDSGFFLKSKTDDSGKKSFDVLVINALKSVSEPAVSVILSCLFTSINHVLVITYLFRLVSLVLA